MHKDTTKIDRICKQCGKPFKAFPFYVRAGRAEHCSVRCRGIAARSGPPWTFICIQCGKSFQVGYCRPNAKTCSAECRSKYRRPIADRFWSKVDKNGPVPAHMPHLGPCWPWISKSCDGDGYGFISLGARGDGRIKAHRFSWSETNGRIPKGMAVLHKCDNPKCVNPAHLFIGTARDNTRDMLDKGRNRHPSGENHFRAKLDWDKVRQIRAIYSSGRIKRTVLGKQFGVSPTTIFNVVHNLNWVAKH